MCFASNYLSRYFCFFFFNDTATTEIYTLSLHDALPISFVRPLRVRVGIEHGRAAAGEVESVLALRQPDARGVTTDHALTTRVFGAVQHKHTPVLHHRGRIEGGMLFPPRDGVTHCRAEPGRGTGRDHRVRVLGFVKRTERPSRLLPAHRLARHSAGREQEHHKGEGLQGAAPAKSVTAAASVRTLPWSAAAGASRRRPLA